METSGNPSEPEDSLIRTARVFNLVKGHVPRLESVTTAAKQGPDLALAAKWSEKTVAVDGKGILA
jgi:hypothetical protein